MSELDILGHLCPVHYVKRRDHTYSTLFFGANYDLILIFSQITVSDVHPHLHGFLIKLSEVVDLLNILRVSLALEVQEGGIVVRKALVVLDVTEDVEEVLVVVFGVLDHVWSILL